MQEGGAKLGDFCMMYEGDVACGDDEVRVSISGHVETVLCLKKFSMRLRGLLGREPDSATRLFVPCNSVHTFGMKHAIDIAFISAKGVVLEVFYGVGPGKILSRQESSIVAERFHATRPWFCVGDEVKIGTV